jgi:hypothetical protein
LVCGTKEKNNFEHLKAALFFLLTAFLAGGERADV